MLAGFAELRLDANLRDAVEHVRHPWIVEAAETLAQSRVPTAEDAAKLAIDELNATVGIDARESWEATGLFRLGRDAPGFASDGDLIWEVRVSRMLAGVSAVIWVSTSTAEARVLFPEPQKQRFPAMEPGPEASVPRP
ncbi:MAG: hypothetical protein DCC67_16515 [Planctomycetota bacterium]|nr:MAG: hypothetical protein DCC67_16515 [Planctomycetota bacterium]